VGRGLFKTSRVFQEAVLALDVVFHRATGESLISTYGLFDDITPSRSLDGIWPIAITLPAIAMLQLALFDTLVHLGIKPDYVVGHSAGETAVMYASGASSRKMAMELAIARGRGMSSMETRDGTMAALACAEERAHELIARVEGQGVAGSLQIGCFNSSTAVTLSGSSKSIDEAVKLAKMEGIFSTRLRTKVPVHSRMMLECENEYRGLVTSVFDKHVIGTASTAAYSSLTGGRFSDVFTADYFWENTIGPVRFCQAMESLVSNIGEASFVEIGPHPVLASYIDSIAAAGSLTLAPLRRPGKITDNSNTELSCFLAFAGQLASSGYNSFNFAALAGCGSGLLQKLPRYPFSPRLWPIWLPSATVSRFQQPRNGPLNFPQLRVNVQTHPSLAQHSIKGEPIMPAAGYIEMVCNLFLLGMHFADEQPGSRVRRSATMGRRIHLYHWSFSKQTHSCRCTLGRTNMDSYECLA
jgi:acyl transferase domain-containing protein